MTDHFFLPLAPDTKRSTSAASPGPFYFAWGCFRDFCIQALQYSAHSVSKTRVERAYEARCHVGDTRSLVLRALRQKSIQLQAIVL